MFSWGYMAFFEIYLSVTIGRLLLASGGQRQCLDCGESRVALEDSKFKEAFIHTWSHSSARLQ